MNLASRSSTLSFRIKDGETHGVGRHAVLEFSERSTMMCCFSAYPCRGLASSPLSRRREGRALPPRKRRPQGRRRRRPFRGGGAAPRRGGCSRAGEGQIIERLEQRHRRQGARTACRPAVYVSLGQPRSEPSAVALVSLNERKRQSISDVGRSLQGITTLFL